MAIQSASGSQRGGKHLADDSHLERRHSLGGTIHAAAAGNSITVPPIDETCLERRRQECGPRRSRGVPWPFPREFVTVIPCQTVRSQK